METIETVRNNPMPRDPAPVALNTVHVTTKEDVILHEVLLRVGAPYRAVLADETARNIRRFIAHLGRRGRPAARRARPTGCGSS